MAFGDTFAGVTEDFKKLPWWAWVGIAGGGFILWQHFQSGSTAATPASSSADTSASGLDSSSGDIPVAGDSGPQPQPIQPPPKLPPPPPPGGKNPPPPPPPKSSKSYTVASGDTLSAIASREGVDEQQLYAQNEGIIEATARQHGFASSDNGHWIFPGTRLVIP